MKNIVTLLVSMCLLAACKTPVAGMQQHPSFTYEAITQNQFIIGGVVSAAGSLDHITRIRFGDLLERIFHKERPELDMIRTGYLFREIGSESFARLLDGYRLTAMVTEQDMDNIRHLFPAARYLVLCRIEKDQVNRQHHESEADVVDSEEDRREGEFEYVRVDVSLATTREMGATLTIYDLRQNVLAWSGYVTQSETNSNHSSRTFNKKNRWQEELADAFVSALIGVDGNSYPAPPSRQEVLEELFEGFAENMPERSGR
jgi:hypothetical protein